MHQRTTSSASKTQTTSMRKLGRRKRQYHSGIMYLIATYLLASWSVHGLVSGWTTSHLLNSKRASQTNSFRSILKNRNNNDCFVFPRNVKPRSSRTIVTASKSSSANQEQDGDDECDNIVILGGGFGGLNTALTLDSLPWPINEEYETETNSNGKRKNKPRIILVDNKERFVFLPLLYELCVGDAEMDEVAPTFKSLLKNNDNIQFMQRSINGIDVEQNKVYLTSTSNKDAITECIPYKSLVVATGASINLSSIKGASKYALPFYTLNDCYDLRKQLKAIELYIQKRIKWQNQLRNNDEMEIEEDVISVVIVGGGYGGVELALNLKERLSIVCGTNTNVKVKISILHRGKEILQYANDYNKKNGQQRLHDAGIEMCTGQSVMEVLPPNSSLSKESDIMNKEKASFKHRCQIVTTNSTLDADLLLWTAGSMSKNEQRDILNSKLPRDSYGRIITNRFLQVKDHSNVFALGDCARPKKIPYGATAAVAMQQAPVAAWNVFSLTRMEQEKDRDFQNSNIKDQFDPLPFDYLDLGQMMTLGGEDATISSPTGLFELDGAVASIARRLIYAVRMPTTQQALTAAISSTNKRLERRSLKKVKKVIDWK